MESVRIRERFSRWYSDRGITGKCTFKVEFQSEKCGAGCRLAGQETITFMNNIKATVTLTLMECMSYLLHSVHNSLFKGNVTTMSTTLYKKSRKRMDNSKRSKENAMTAYTVSSGSIGQRSRGKNVGLRTLITFPYAYLPSPRFPTYMKTQDSSQFVLGFFLNILKKS